MKNRPCMVFLAALSVLAAAASGPRAEWIENGNPICTYEYTQGGAQIIAYAEGVYFIAWEDMRDDGDIYAQAIGAQGGDVAGWMTNGNPVCTTAGGQGSPMIARDDAYGAIIVWKDNRTDVGDLYAQRIDISGTVLWATDGVPVCTASDYQFNHRVIADGYGGAIIVWTDERNGNFDLYVQRIDADGYTLWTSNGVPVCTETGSQMNAQLVSDGTGGAIICWNDPRGVSVDIYAQRVDASGNVRWTSDGIPICTAADVQTDARITSDGGGGAIIAWHDYRSGSNDDIYAQRVAQSGYSYWTADGVAICTEATNQAYPILVFDGSHGAIIAWQDSRNGNADLYAQRINGYGQILWTADGIAITNTADWEDYFYEITSDGDGGAIIAWDSNYGDGTNYDVFAQRIAGDGTMLWEENGVPVCTAVSGQGDPAIDCDGHGGAVIAWGDGRNGFTADIYAQRIERSGYWGYPAPSIVGLRDVPGDQGGYVNLSWNASRLDLWPDQLITTYTVWRSIDAEAAMLMADGGARIVTALSDDDLITEDPVIRHEMRDGFGYWWKLISTLDAYHLDMYSEVVPTLFDSSAVTTEMHYFQVIAHTADPEEYWISDAQSGYSVDNLAPCPPLGLAGEQSYSPEGLALSWDPNTEEDLLNYRVYRGLSDDFVPGPGNLLSCPTDTFSFDGGWHWSENYWYKVSAVDIHGNESPFAVLGPSEITGDDTPGTPHAWFLGQNYPNPFNPTTVIAFSLKAPADVSLRIYDAGGRLVRTLVDARYEAGSFRVEWNGLDSSGMQAASGVYFYRLKASDFDGTRKMVLLR